MLIDPPIHMDKNDRTHKTVDTDWSFISQINPKTDKLDLDELDLSLIRAMVKGGSSSDIAEQLKRPLSTVQRRIRKIEQKGFVSSKPRPNLEAFGFKRGMIEIEISTTDHIDICDKLLSIEGIISASAYLGNTDATAVVIYKDSKQALKVMSKVKQLTGITDVRWSEEVYSVSK